MVQEGAPAGIEQFAPDDGVFPPVEQEDTPDPEELSTSIDTFVNYDGFDDDDDAWREFQSFVNRDPPMLKQCDTLQECRSFLQAEPVLSRFGNTNKRIILDEKQSGVTRHTRRTHGLLLHRASDAVNDGLGMADGMQRSEDIEQMVLDIVDAFWTVPNHPLEWKYSSGTPQGSSSAPFSWGYILALVVRLTQGMLDPSRGRL